jgi:hypothetical protein
VVGNAKCALVKGALFVAADGGEIDSIVFDMQWKSSLGG